MTQCLWEPDPQATLPVEMSHIRHRTNNEAASTMSDDQDRFLAKVKAAEPRRCTTPTSPGQEVTQPTFTPDILFDSAADSFDDQHTAIGLLLGREPNK